MSRILPIVLIVLSACLGYFYIYPTWSGDVTTQQQQISSYNQALDAAKNFSTEQKNLVSKSSAITPDELANLQEYMPDSVDNIQLILDLTSLADRYGVSLSNFSIQDNDASDSGAQGSAASAGTANSGTPANSSLFQSSGATNSLDLSVNATGTYEDFLAFLTAVELSRRPLDVMKLSLTNSDTGVYTYSMTFRIYWLSS
jgi:hypothetical protein